MGAFFIFAQNRLCMRKKPTLSLHRCICVASGFCLLLPPVCSLLRTRAVPGPGGFTAALLAASAVLLLLPLGEERRSPSLYFLLLLSASCLGGPLAAFADDLAGGRDGAGIDEPGVVEKQLLALALGEDALHLARPEFARE